MKYFNSNKIFSSVPSIPETGALVNHSLKPIKVLLLEDNPDDARLVQSALGEQSAYDFEIIWVVRLADALARIEAEYFEIVLSDLCLPDSKGLATAQTIIVHAPTMPLVVMTGSSDAELGREAIRLGAQDYIIKGELSGDMIAHRLGYAIERQRLQSDLFETNATLEQRVTDRTVQLESTIQRLSQSEQRQRSLFEGALDAIFVTDESSRIIEANSAASRLSGYSTEELKCRYCADLMPEHFRTQANQIILEFRRNGILDCELPLLTRDGQERILRVSGSRVASDLYINIAQARRPASHAAQTQER